MPSARGGREGLEGDRCTRHRSGLMATRHGPKRVIKRPARLDEAPTTAPEPAAKKKKVGKPKTRQVVESVAADAW